MSALNPFKITHAEASAAILKAVSEKTLIQKKWHTKAPDGREMACLLGSIHPKVQQPADCNGDLMPLWLAELVPTLFDGLASDKVWEIGERAGLLINQWHVITEEGWNRVLTKFLCRLIDDALNSARPVSKDVVCWGQVESACNDVMEALRSGDKKKIEKARDAAKAVGYATHAAAWAAVNTAAVAAVYAAAGADAAAAVYAAVYVADAAAYAAAYVAHAAAKAVGYATHAAVKAAANARIFTFLLDIIETEITEENLKPRIVKKPRTPTVKKKTKRKKTTKKVKTSRKR